jgi:hypothetical protein
MFLKHSEQTDADTDALVVTQARRDDGEEIDLERHLRVQRHQR